MSKTDDLRKRLAEIDAALTALGTRSDEDFTDQDRTDWEALNPERDEIQAELDERAERAARLSILAAATGQTMTGDGAAGFAQDRATFNQINKPDTDNIYDRSKLNVDNPADGATYRDRALRIIDSWRGVAPSAKENAARLVEYADDDATGGRNSAREIADHIIRFDNPAYVRSFKKFIKYGAGVLNLLDREEAVAFADSMAQSRALNEGSTAAGQAIVPPYLDPTIMLSNVGTDNPFRQMATVKTITTQTWKGVTSAGVSAEWSSEAAEVSDQGTPTFSQPSITPVRGDAWIQVSFEMVEDTAIANDVAMLFADARDRLEGTAFAVGTGSTQPRGIVTALNLVTASRTSVITNASIGYADLLAADANLPPRFRHSGTNWVLSKGIADVIRALPLPSSVNFSPWVDFGGALPSSLIGYNVNLSSAMINSLSVATASTDAVAVLGDFRKGYFIVDRIGMSIASVPIVLGANRRPTGEMGWMCWWRTSADAVIPSAFQMLIA